MTGYDAGGKKFGLMKTRQQSELESINQVYIANAWINCSNK